MAGKPKKPTLKEIGERIHAHLVRFENDPKINHCKEGTTLHPYYCASAHGSGRFVYVSYISFQSSSHLKRDDALAYLAWLDAGNVGRHYEALREIKKKENSNEATKID